MQGPDDLLRRLMVESGENTCRVDFLPSEAVALGRLIEEAEREAARERQALAGPSEGQGAKQSGSGNVPEAVRGDSRDKVGAVVGMSGKTYEKARAVVEAAEREPEKFAPLAQEMDRKGTVDRPFRKLQSARQKAAPNPPAEPGRYADIASPRP